MRHFHQFIYAIKIYGLIKIRLIWLIRALIKGVNVKFLICKYISNINPRLANN